MVLLLAAPTLTVVAGPFLTLLARFLSSAFSSEPLLPGWMQAVTTSNPRPT